MVKIEFEIPQDKIQKVIDAMVGMYPIPQDEGEEEPQFTPAQWAKESMKRFVVNTVKRWETKLAQDAINVIQDNNLIS